MDQTKTIVITWSLTLIFLFGDYVYFQIPLQRSFIHAALLIGQKEYLKAREEINCIIRVDPYYIPAYVNRWYLDKKEKNRKAAKEVYIQMRELYLKNQESHTARKFFYEWIRDPDRAITFYDNEVMSRYVVNFLGKQ